MENIAPHPYPLSGCEEKELPCVDAMSGWEVAASLLLP
ncbi:hypothetical protein ACVIDN_002521 [Rhizobium brockwellii]